MRFLRTAPTGRLLATILGAIVLIVAGTAIAVAATDNGPVPKAQPLAASVHSALSASKVPGITAHIKFTNTLLTNANLPGDTVDPILQGASGRLWLSPGHGLRLELQSGDGDAQVVVNQSSFWIYDPTSQTVYEGTLPAHSSSTSGQDSAGSDAVPTVANLQSRLNKLMAHVNVTGADSSDPTDVAGRPAYSVKISPQHDGGLLGAAKLAWDAVTGVPLDIAVYAQGDSSPVLELQATDISYDAVGSSVFSISPPSGAKVVKIATAQTGSSTAKKAHGKHADVHGVAAVAAQLPFTFNPPATVDGLARHDVSLLDWGGSPAALVTYGQNLGGIAVIEQSAPASGGSSASPSQGQSGQGGSELSLPTVSINGATGQELDTALGTVVRFTQSGVAYTVLGSVPPYAADAAAKALTATTSTP